MRLKAWRALTGKTLQEIADGIGVANPGTIEKHEKGFQTPEPALQLKYAQYTEGAVTAQDWLEQFEETQADPPQRRARPRKPDVEAAA